MNLLPLYKLPQKDVKFAVTESVRDSIIEIIENVAKSAKLTLQLPLPEEQLVILCDAMEHAVGYRTDIWQNGHDRGNP